MSHMDVRGIIDRAKEVFGVDQDQELAAALGVDRTTISSWKRRRSVPAKYLSAMLNGGAVSLDWLVKGRGRKTETNDFGLSEDRHEVVDPRILWIALSAVAAEFLASTNSEEGLLGEILGKHDHLASLFIHLDSYLKRVTASYAKWEKSGLVVGDDIYRALYTEFHAVGSFDMRDAPWLEEGDIDADGSQ